MNTEENYIQRAWSDSIDYITIEDVREAISEIQEMDDEHGAFWVGIFDEDEYILEANKDLSLIGVFDPESDEQIKYKAKDWNEIENLFCLFLDGQLEEVRLIMKSN